MMHSGLNHTSRFSNIPTMMDLMFPTLVSSLRDLETRLMLVSKSGFTKIEAEDPVPNAILHVVRSSLVSVLIRHAACRHEIPS